jgi:hypothetical protein
MFIVYLGDKKHIKLFIRQIYGLSVWKYMCSLLKWFEHGWLHILSVLNLLRYDGSSCPGLPYDDYYLLQVK